LLVSFITFVVYRYKKKQILYLNNINDLKVNFENDLLKSQLEIQEQTFQNISQEIHDNIGQKLTLAKLHLNTLDISDKVKVEKQLNNTIQIIGEAINDLSDLSRSMSSEIILNNGFIKALEFEVNQLNKPGIYSIKLTTTGEPVFMDAQKELLLFRIVQEALNNIVKHAEASEIKMDLYFTEEKLRLTISDNGKGFIKDEQSLGNGFINMSKRATMLNGKCDIQSNPGTGTSIIIQIPLYESKEKL
jgi:signal transduction histidine kinase